MKLRRKRRAVKKKDEFKDGLLRMMMMVLSRRKNNCMTKERDATATRKLAEPKLTQREEEEAVQRSNALEEDGIGAIRKVSRQEY